MVCKKIVHIGDKKMSEASLMESARYYISWYKSQPVEAAYDELLYIVNEVDSIQYQRISPLLDYILSAQFRDRIFFENSSTAELVLIMTIILKQLIDHQISISSYH